MTVILTGSDLSVEELVAVARGREEVAIHPAARLRMEQARAIVEQALLDDAFVYGLTTGVGMRRHTRVPPASIGSFNDRLIPSHRIAQGPLASPDLVRAVMVRLLNGFAKGYAGVRPTLADNFVGVLNRGAAPPVRLYGSIGQSDLGPMADLAHGVLDGSPLAAKEGLALVNNNAFSTAAATLALVDAGQLLATLDLTAALDLEAFAANPSILHPLVLEARPFPELALSFRRIRAALAGSYLWEKGSPRNLQDPLSFRSVLGLHGAAGTVLRFARDQTAIELNTSQDNPVVVADERKLLSMGNHEIQLLATSLDAVRIALAPALTAAAERTVKLLQTHHSGLPEGLAQRAGLAEDGLAEYGVSCQAIASEARLLAQPVSFDLVSSSQADGIEDRATNAPLAARRLSEMVSLGERLLAVALIVSCQAVELRSCVLGEQTQRAFDLVRERVRFVAEGDDIPPDIEPVRDLVHTGALAGALEAETEEAGR